MLLHFRAQLTLASDSSYWFLLSLKMSENETDGAQDPDI
jgi:hypothetical protein